MNRPEKFDNKVIENIDSAQKYLDLAEAIFLLLDCDGNVTLINKKGSELLGYKVEDIIGNNWFNNFIPDCERDKVLSVFKKVIQGKLEPVEFFENKVLTKLGKQRTIAWHNTRLIDDSDEIIGTLSTGIDITNQILAEQRFKQVIELSPNGIIMVNERGQITLVNKQVEKFFGYKRNELIGESIEILVPTENRSNHIGFRKDFLLNPKTRPMGEGRDLFAIRKDSSLFPVEIGLSSIETDDGKAVLASVVDITERKNAEKVLKESEQKLQAILDNTTDAILVYNDSGGIITINNQARKLFYDDKNKLDNIAGIIPPDQLNNHSIQLEQVKNGASLMDYETERILSNGQRMVVSVALSYMSGADGMYIETIRDISERVAIRNKIIDIEKAQIIANMAEGVAHHMGTPLASMLLRVQMLKEDIEILDAEHNMQDKLQSIENQILYGQKVMQRLLKFASKPITEKTRINIKNIVNDAVEILRPLLSKKKIEFVINIKNNYYILADSNLIQLVFSDIIINSVDAIDRKGSINITARKSNANGSLTIKISDTGSGIPEEVIPYVFEPFYTTKTAGKGTGLGLAVAKRIIHEHGGQIRIESKRDRGTDIIIDLPLYKGDDKN